MNRLILVPSLAIAMTCLAMHSAGADTSLTVSPTTGTAPAPEPLHVPKSRHQATAEISRILDKLREFERTLDPAVYDTCYPDEPIVIINGMITHPRKADTLRELKLEREQREQRLNDYRVIDLKQPLIGVSEDGSMAWSVVQQRKEEIDRRNGATLRTWDYSTLMVFEQVADGTWRLVTLSHSGDI